MGLRSPDVDRVDPTGHWPEYDPGPECDTGRVAAVMAALASPARLEIVRLLGHEDLAVSALAERLGLAVANTSQHLGRLRKARLVVSCRHGTRIVNTLADPGVLDVCLAACAAAGARLEDARLAP